MEENNPVIKAKFIYNITNHEEDVAFRSYQRKFVLKGVIVKSLIFAALAVVFLVQAVTSENYPLGWGLFGVCLAFIAFIWYNPYKIRKNLLVALKDLENDKYEFELFEDYFSIRTILPPEEISQEISEEDIQDDEPTEIPPRIVYFYKEPIEIIEHPEQFIIILKKQTIYTIPKRCLTDEEIKVLQEGFAEKINENYSHIDK